MRNREFLGLGLLSILWLTIQGLLFSNYGFVTDFEGAKYQEEASLLINSFGVSKDRIFYATYSLLIASFNWIGLGVYGVFVFQLLVSFWATYRFYCLSKYLLKSIPIAAITTGILILSFQIQLWNYHLFTESLFVSGLILFFYRLLVHRLNSNKEFIRVGVLLLLLSFLRPNGILLLAPLFVFLYMNKAHVKNSIVGFSFLLLIALFVVVSNLVFSSQLLSEYTQLAYLNKWVVWKQDYYTDPQEVSILVLLIDRFLFYFSMIRTHYSMIHNIIMMSFYPVYLLAFMGTFSMWRNNKAFSITIIITILLFSMLNILTFLNWHSRFIVPILPFFILIAGFGIQNIMRKIQK